MKHENTSLSWLRRYPGRSEDSHCQILKKTLPMSISFPDVRITDHLEGTKYIQISGEQPFRWFPWVSNANLEYECWWNISNAPCIIIVYTLIYPHWPNIGCTPQKMMGKCYVSVLYMELLKMDLFFSRRCHFHSIIYSLSSLSHL